MKKIVTEEVEVCDWCEEDLRNFAYVRHCDVCNNLGCPSHITDNKIHLNPGESFEFSYCDICKTSFHPAIKKYNEALMYHNYMIAAVEELKKIIEIKVTFDE